MTPARRLHFIEYALIAGLAGMIVSDSLAAALVGLVIFAAAAIAYVRTAA